MATGKRLCALPRGVSPSPRARDKRPGFLLHLLAGLIAGLMAKGAEPFNAARMGAYLSGLAGDIAFDELGYSMRATDVITIVPKA